MSSTSTTDEHVNDCVIDDTDINQCNNCGWTYEW